VEVDPQFEHVRIQASADKIPVGSRKYNFCMFAVFPKKILRGLAITATAVTLVVTAVPACVLVPAPQEMVSFEYRHSPGGPQPEVMYTA
jgi:hypothetical protein